MSWEKYQLGEVPVGGRATWGKCHLLGAVPVGGLDREDFYHPVRTNWPSPRAKIPQLPVHQKNAKSSRCAKFQLREVPVGVGASREASTEGTGSKNLTLGPTIFLQFSRR